MCSEHINSLDSEQLDATSQKQSVKANRIRLDDELSLHIFAQSYLYSHDCAEPFDNARISHQKYLDAICKEKAMYVPVLRAMSEAEWKLFENASLPCVIFGSPTTCIPVKEHAVNMKLKPDICASPSGYDILEGFLRNAIMKCALLDPSSRKILASAGCCTATTASAALTPPLHFW